MGKLLALHQPNFFPWIGYFHKMARADVWVILDDVQVPNGRSYAYRTRIKTPTGPDWLFLPLPGKGNYTYRKQPLMPSEQWADRIRSTLQVNYGKTAYFGYGDFELCFEEAIESALTISDLNMFMIEWATEVLDIHPELVWQSATDIVATSYMIAVRMCERYDCDIYLSGTGAKAYNNPNAFKNTGIELRYDEFVCPEYAQVFGPFIPNLSVLDLIFNCGPDASKVLR